MTAVIGGKNKKKGKKRERNKNELNILYLVSAWYLWRMWFTLEPTIQEKCGTEKGGKKDPKDWENIIYRETMD